MRLALVIAFVLGVLAYNVRPYLWDEAFYHLIAAEFVLLYWVIWRAATGIWKYLVQVMLLTCLNSLVDEIFFDPTLFEINEYVGFIIIIILTFLFYLKNEVFSKRLGD